MIPKFLQMSAWIWKIVRTVFWDISWFQKFGRTWNFVEIKLCKLLWSPLLWSPLLKEFCWDQEKYHLFVREVVKMYGKVIRQWLYESSVWPLLKICWSIITYQHQLFPGKWVSPLISQIFSNFFFLLLLNNSWTFK